MDRKAIEELLVEHGIKATPNRLIIAEALAEAALPLSLSELEIAIGTIDKSNIFRTLMTFKDCHLVHALEDGSDGVRYELCRSHGHDRDEDLHVHFHCEKCGKTFCLEDTPIPEVSVPEGFAPHSANYIIKGICPSCSRS